MPIGGLGAGCICLNGYGGIQDFSIHTRPETTALPAGFSANSSEAAFTDSAYQGTEWSDKALVEGPFPPFKIFDQGLQGQGLRRGGFEGFPRFAKCTFTAEYPFGEASLSDPALPIEVKLVGWNPFIPLDDKNSGIPCAILEYTLRNTSARPVDYEFSYHLSHTGAAVVSPINPPVEMQSSRERARFSAMWKSRMLRPSVVPVSR